MPSSKSNPGWRRSWLVGVLGIGLLVVVLVVIWFAWPASAPSPGSTSTSPRESSVKADTKEQRNVDADGDARGASWVSFERILLLAVVVANYLLLAAVAWSYWTARRPNLDVDLAQRLQALGTRLDAIERALLAGSPKPTTPSSPAITDTAPSRPKVPERPTEPAPRPAPEPVRRAPVFQESPSPLARKGPIQESRRSPESNAWKLVIEYCQVRESSIVDLAQRARELGLKSGSPSSTPRQRVLDGLDPDVRLLAIKDGREEKLFVVVGADATVAESEWLDLFEMRSFPGYCTVRSKRPAIVNAVSGDVEDKGELEVLGPT